MTALRPIDSGLAAAAMACFLWLAGIAASTGPAGSQEPNADANALRFDIQRFQVDGNSLLKPDAIEGLLAPYAGKPKDVSDVQRALEALEIAYRDLRYGTVQVILPEQNIASGIVMFNVMAKQSWLKAIIQNVRFGSDSAQTNVRSRANSGR